MLGKAHPAHNGSRVHTTGILKNESIQLQQPQPSRPMDWIFGCFLHSHTQDMSEKQITLQILHHQHQGMDCRWQRAYTYIHSIICNAYGKWYHMIILWQQHATASSEVKLEGCPIHTFTQISPSINVSSSICNRNLTCDARNHWVLHPILAWWWCWQGWSLWQCQQP